MNQETILKMEAHVQELEGNLSHGRRVYLLSKLIGEKDGIPYDEDTLAFAAYFHDIGACPSYAPQGIFDHALESSKVIPGLAKEYGYKDEQIEILVEAAKYHDRAGMGKHNETRLIRNADGIDYLGYMAVARDFAKFPKDMGKALATLKRRKDQFYSIIDLPFAKELAMPRLEEMEHFITRFEEESFGM